MRILERGRLDELATCSPVLSRDARKLGLAHPEDLKELHIVLQSTWCICPRQSAPLPPQRGLTPRTRARPVSQAAERILRYDLAFAQCDGSPGSSCQSSESYCQRSSTSMKSLTCPDLRKSKSEDLFISLKHDLPVKSSRVSCDPQKLMHTTCRWFISAAESEGGGATVSRSSLSSDSKRTTIVMQCMILPTSRRSFCSPRSRKGWVRTGWQAVLPRSESVRTRAPGRAGQHSRPQSAKDKTGWVGGTKNGSDNAASDLAERELRCQSEEEKREPSSDAPLLELSPPSLPPLLRVQS